MDRIKIFQLIIFAVSAVIIARLFYWQAVAKIERKAMPDTSQNLPAPRGEIFSSDNFPLVANQEAFLLYAKPQDLKKNPSEVAAALSPFLISEKYATSSSSLSEEEKKKKEETQNKEAEIEKRLSDKSLFWVQLSRKVPLEAKNKISNLNIAGIGFEKDTKRLYPEASMAATLLGFVASDKFGQDTGYFGLEGYYDKRLRGTPGTTTGEIDPFGFPILVGAYRPIEPKKGASLYLSLDRAIQFIVEEKLRRDVEKYGAKDGLVVVAEPKTGHILAMATSPTYNPAIFSEYGQDLFKNPVVADTYEPGSTFKLITMSAALDLNLITPSTRCEICTGPRQIGGFEISTWNKKYYPNSTMAEVIEHSDNIGMTYVADKLGIDNFAGYIDKFGFGKTTGVDLQEESTGNIRPKREWRPIDLATASFGQGIAVTPIQMLQAVSLIASGGRLTTPKIVEKIKEDGKEEKIKPDREDQIISPKTAAQITEMMVSAVEHGEAQVFAPKGYRIAGKTGTAQIPVAGHYDPNKTIASFVGFAPADNPKFVMLVRFTEPTSSPFGAETAAPTFFSIANELFNYYGIPPKN